MNLRKDVIELCAYFFEVLIKQFLAVENNIHKKSGLLSLFKKINFLDRATDFNSLMERAVELRDNLSISDDIKGDSEIYSMAVKLKDCLAIYIMMLESQVKINTSLDHKAHGEKYDRDEYEKCLVQFDVCRLTLKAKLTNLYSLYEEAIKTQIDTQEVNQIQLKEESNLELTKELTKEEKLKNEAYNLIMVARAFAYTSTNILENFPIEFDILRELDMKESYEFFLSVACVGLAFSQMKFEFDNNSLYILSHAIKDNLDKIYSDDELSNAYYSMARFLEEWDDLVSKSGLDVRDSIGVWVLSNSCKYVRAKRTVRKKLCESRVSSVLGNTVFNEFGPWWKSEFTEKRKGNEKIKIF
ncbi:hypothetical protein [Oceanirhabdus seepicola]|uniref:Uncharacterized protein n=1 Tax=Oceanirhabdus seepicola TaxID=2828781 RepID=A0A9J6P718_9CLOT|nr:hypothetical protein [Oceanirhabdus seepicola]MCM1991304.1 hypothetical protein [Oceanirhabdus seepicola]